MLTGSWLLIETLGRADTWSMIAAGTAPRAWKSIQRAVPSRLQPVIGAVYGSGAPIDQQLPQSRHAWSGRRLLAVPVLGRDTRVHAVKLWLGDGEPPAQVGAAPFTIDARTRRVDTLPGLGPHFATEPISWLGAQSYETIERFDGALEFTATLARSSPDSRWLGVATVRSQAGPRSILLAARNGGTDATRTQWLGVAADVTESVAPQSKSFEAGTLDMLRERQPNLYLAIVDTAQVRLIRWVSEPVPGLRWSGADERTIPHPADRARILAARDEIRSGAQLVTLADIRLAAENGSWITADLEITPLPGGTPDAEIPEFALVQMEIRSSSPGDRPL
ncbi:MULTISPECIES: GAF domain-containing protein [unclassified Nocardia]|uniref:GAF domain-containing protein n=1 Tax=unclassified Nocardia TaxID=2637762 RepID=UPI001CE464D4|nr:MULTISPECIES: GAF domain-containing protein [unclassified Nocardia]